MPHVIDTEGIFDACALQKYFAGQRVEWTERSKKDLCLMQLSGLFAKTSKPNEYKLVVMNSWFRAYVKSGVDVIQSSLGLCSISAHTILNKYSVW